MFGSQTTGRTQLSIGTLKEELESIYLQVQLDVNSLEMPRSKEYLRFVSVFAKIA
jgi:hypothetical protein